MEYMYMYTFALVLPCILHLSTALYFHINGTERTCFVEKIPDETMVVGNYKVQAYDANVEDSMPVNQEVGMHVDVADPDEKVFLSRTYAAEGRFTFTSRIAGEHIICLNFNSSSAFSAGQLRIHLDINVREHAIDYPQVQDKRKVSELQLRIRQLMSQVEQISREQNYQRYHEERFRQTSSSTNQRVLWWFIAQSLILLITGFWQTYHLKRCFEVKKENEEKFMETSENETSESFNGKAFVWAIFQLFIMIGLVVWQLMHLKSFFILKKLD